MGDFKFIHIKVLPKSQVLKQNTFYFINAHDEILYGTKNII